MYFCERVFRTDWGGSIHRHARVRSIPNGIDAGASLWRRRCRAIDSGAIGGRARRWNNIKGPAQWRDIDGLFRNRGRLHKPCRIDHIREIASAVESALNASPVNLGTITGTIVPVSIAVNVTVERESTAVQVNSVGGKLYNGAYVCATSDTMPVQQLRSDQSDRKSNDLGARNGAGRAWMVFVV